ncbi:MAG: hypothetical protein U0736_01680 [Gemmataceae bacterium]
MRRVLVEQPPKRRKRHAGRGRSRRGGSRRIAGLIGQPLASDERTHALRPVQAGDVVILFRAMSNVHLYEARARSG